MTITIDFKKVKDLLTKLKFTDLIMLGSWITIHLGIFSKVEFSTFLIGAGVANFCMGLILKACYDNRI